MKLDLKDFANLLDDVFVETLEEGLDSDNESEEKLNMFSKRELAVFNTEYRLYGNVFGTRFIINLISKISKNNEDNENKED